MKLIGREAVRVAILSDIHGNLVGLEAIVSDLKTRKVEEVVCLGDVAASGPQPSEVVERLQKLGWPCVMGNTDETLAKNIPEKLGKMSEREKRRLKELDEWTRNQLRKTHRDYVSTFKPTILFNPRNDPNFPRLVCYHGSPRSNQEGIFATTPDDRLTKYFADQKSGIFAGGHTHTQMFRRFRNSVVINPGSVGLPAEKHVPGILGLTHAEYALLSLSRRSFTLELLSIRYPFGDLEKAVRNSDLPNPNKWLSDW